MYKHLPEGGGISAYVTWEENMKRGRERKKKEENVLKKRKKAKRKRENGKLKGSISAKQGRIKTKGRNRSQKTTCSERVKKYHFQKGRGIEFSDQNIDPWGNAIEKRTNRKCGKKVENVKT